VLTFYEVCEKLTRLDELTLLETLEINSDDIVNKFEERISDRLEELSDDFEADDAELNGTGETNET
jgi:hypothetical protein